MYHSMKESQNTDRSEISVGNGTNSESRDVSPEEELSLVAGCNQTGHNLSSLVSALQLFCKALGQQRNLIAFWVFGLATNFPFIISLSAAQDILSESPHHPNNSTNSSFNDSSFILVETNLGCKFTGTGTVLLSAILPDLIVKLLIGVSPGVFSYTTKTIICSILTTSSFLILAFVKEIYLKFVGVILSSIACGLGEVTFMSLSCFYFKDVVSTWSSGTGSAGVFGAIMYAGLTSMGVSTRTCLLGFLTFPAVFILTYFFILLPYDNDGAFNHNINADDEIQHVCEDNSQINGTLSLAKKLSCACKVVKYVIPLLIVYFAVYIIVQGIVELLYFKNTFLTPSEQYRWYQASYRMGVFISRSSVKLFRFERLYLFPIVPSAAIGLFVFEIYYNFIPSFWIVFALVFITGFLQGICYVNTFVLITTEETGPRKGIGLGLATASRPLGIILAGAISIPLHHLFCRTAPNM